MYNGPKDHFGSCIGTQANAINILIAKSKKQLSPQAIAKALELPMARVYNHMKYLKDNGHINYI